MTNYPSLKLSKVFSMGVLVTGIALTQAQARAGLTFDEGSSIETDAAAPAPALQKREEMRQSLGALEPGEGSQAQPLIQQQVVPAQAQPQRFSSPFIEVGPAQIEKESEKPSRSELLRRERVRQELRNEDLLQERLETLRLRDEQRRSQQLFGGGDEAVRGTSESAYSADSVIPAPAPAPVVEQKVVAPITERPGQSQVQKLEATPASSGYSGAAVSTASVSSLELDRVDSQDFNSFQVMPRVGLTEMSGNAGYDIRPRFSTGVSLGVATSQHLTFEVGYSYGEYGVALASANPYVMWANQYGYLPSTESVAMKQNILEAGLKVHFLGPDAKLRPFMGGGAGYSLSYINYDQRILDQLNRDPYLRTLAGDYELSSYLGYLSTGVDLRVNRSISVGAVFKYYNVFSSRERSPLSHPAMYGAFGYPYYTLPDSEKAYVSGTFARTNFYSVMAGVTFTF